MFIVMRRAVLQEDEGQEHICGLCSTRQAADERIAELTSDGYFKDHDFYVLEATKRGQTQ